MKLDDWDAQWNITRINQILPPEQKWPALDELLLALKDLPRRSVKKSGYGIFIGWKKVDEGWAYHHGICMPSYSGKDGIRYGFHGDCGLANIREQGWLIPTFNVGDLPESSIFLDAMESVGLERPRDRMVMGCPKIRANKRY
jgi:hypothetical protein